MAAVSCPMCLRGSFTEVGHLVSALINFIQRPLTCPVCATVAASATALSEHLAIHLAPPPPLRPDLACKQCAFTCNNFGHLQSHVETEHSEKKFLCVHCYKPFKVQASLTLHLRMAHQICDKSPAEKQHQCQYCDKKFASFGRKQAHEKVHQHELAPCSSESNSAVSSPAPADGESEQRAAFSCFHCDKTFKKEQYLQQHIKTHEAKKWECSVCRKLFTTKEYLRKHARLHTEEKPYACEQCGKKFTFQQSYHKHLLYHSDERPYACDQCNRRFKELSTLHNHQRIHTGEKPYACDVCGKAFRQRVSYVVHRRIHTGALPYVCPTCGKSFRYKVSQRTHKCEMSQPNEIVRPRSDWLEKLMNAHHQVAVVQDVTRSDEPMSTSEGLGSTVRDYAVAGPRRGEPNQLGSNAVMNPTSYYEGDVLSTLDLSQLSLDSELIFPS